MSEGLAFEELARQMAVALAGLRREQLWLPADKPIGTLEDELERGRAAFLLIPGTRVELSQTLYQTTATLWLNDLVIAQASDGTRLYAEAVVLVNALSHSHFSRG